MQKFVGLRERYGNKPVVLVLELGLRDTTYGSNLDLQPYGVSVNLGDLVNSFHLFGVTSLQSISILL
jgi:hypothetical protein